MSQLFTSGDQSIGVSTSASVLPMNIQDLISFRMDWFDLLAVQGTLKSLLQHHSSKASIRQHSAFFKVQLSHPYMTTGKIKALARWTFVDLYSKQYRGSKILKRELPYAPSILLLGIYPKDLKM